MIPREPRAVYTSLGQALSASSGVGAALPYASRQVSSVPIECGSGSGPVASVGHPGGLDEGHRGCDSSFWAVFVLVQGRDTALTVEAFMGRWGHGQVLVHVEQGEAPRLEILLSADMVAGWGHAGDG